MMKSAVLAVCLSFSAIAFGASNSSSDVDVVDAEKAMNSLQQKGTAPFQAQSISAKIGQGSYTASPSKIAEEKQGDTTAIYVAEMTVTLEKGTSADQLMDLLTDLSKNNSDKGLKRIVLIKSTTKHEGFGAPVGESLSVDTYVIQTLADGIKKDHPLYVNMHKYLDTWLIN